MDLATEGSALCRGVCTYCIVESGEWYHCAPHPSGPLKHLSVDDAELLLLQAVLRVLGPAGVVDEDGQQHQGGLQEEVQRRVEVEEEEREGSDQHGGDLTRQHVEHVVPELEDEGNRLTQGGWSGEGETRGLHWGGDTDGIS